MEKTGWKFVRDLYHGVGCDVDLENTQAYEKYFIHYPWELGSYENYTLEKARIALEHHMCRLTRKDFPSYGLGKDDLKNKVIWDLGSAVGFMPMCFSKYYGAKEVHAFDQSENCIKWGRHLSELSKISNIHFHKCNLYELSQMHVRNPPDIIFCQGVLHHMFDLRRVAQAIASKCIPDTVLYCTHSSYRTRVGLVKYYKNHLSWARGGDNLERRLEVGKRIWRSWLEKSQTPDEILNNQLTDWAGALYVARRKKTVLKAFDDCSFVTRSLSSFKWDDTWRKQNWKNYISFSPIGEFLFRLPPMFFRAIYRPSDEAV